MKHVEKPANSAKGFVGITYEPIDMETRRMANDAVIYFGKEMLQKTGKIDEGELIRKSFQLVSGKSEEELMKTPLEYLELDAKSNDQLEAVIQATEPSAGGYKHKSRMRPTFHDLFKKGKVAETSDLEEVPRVELPIGITDDQKTEYAIKEIDMMLPDLELHKGRFRTTYRLADFDYGRMNSIVDAYDVKTVHKALKIMKDDPSENRRKRVGLLKKRFEKEEGIYSKRNKLIGAGLLAISGGALATTFVGASIQNSHPAENYAHHDGIPSSVNVSALDKSWNLDNGTKEKAIIDYASHLDAPHMQKFVNALLSAGDVTAEYHQAQFLGSLTKSEQLKAIDDGKSANFNWDGDLYSNYFEKFISHTPYDVKNDIYVIMLTAAGPDYKPNTEMNNFLIKEAKIPADHVHWLYSENNNSKNLENAINVVAQEAGKNDNVLVILGGEGSKGHFGFWGGNNDDASYQWLNNDLSKINPRLMTIVVEACYSGSAIPYLESGSIPRTILTSCSAEEKGIYGPAHDFLMAFKNKSADNDGNGYVSVGEAMDYDKKVFIQENLGNITPQIGDVNNIGSSTYLFDIEVNYK